MRTIRRGEIFGIAGQTIAMLASLGAIVLVWKGFSLGIRRYAAWRLWGKRAGVVPHLRQSRSRTFR